MTNLWTVPKDLPYLNGHFPGRPIVPGVAILDKSVEVIRGQLGLAELKLKRVKSAKFLAPLEPGSTVEIRAFAGVDGAWNIEWLSGKVPIVKLVLVF